MWVDAEQGNLSEGVVRLKWPDGWVGMERLQNVGGRLSVMTSHRGIDFAAPLEGQGFKMDDGKPEEPVDAPTPAAASKPELPPGVPVENAKPQSQLPPYSEPPETVSESRLSDDETPPPATARRVKVAK